MVAVLSVALLSSGARGASEFSTKERRQAALGSTIRLDDGLKAVFSNEGAFKPLPEPQSGDWLLAHPETGQTYDQYVASFPNRPDASRGIIFLQPLGGFSAPGAPSLDFLKRFAAAFFGLPVKVLPAMRLAGARINERINAFTGKRQFLTSDIRGRLSMGLPPRAFCLLGLTTEDLYPGPGWNFVFGEASLTARTAVYSFARYDPAFYGQSLKDGKQLALLRSCKVLAHETGHMFGMKHCIYYSCLMNGSNSMGETDAQPLHLCPVCLRKLQWNIGFDPVVRYRRLHALCFEAGFQEEALWLAGEIIRLQPPGASR